MAKLKHPERLHPPKAGLILALALPLAMLPLGCAMPVASPAPFEASHPLATGLTLALTYGTGTVTLKEGRSGSIEVMGTQRLGNRERAGEVDPIAFHLEGDVLHVAPAPQGKGGGSAPSVSNQTVRYDITLPPGTNVTIEALGGTIRAEGLSGDVAISLHQGDIDLRGGGGLNRVTLGEGEISAIGIEHLDLRAIEALVYVEGLRSGGELELNKGELSLVEGRGSITARVETGSLRVESSDTVGDLHLFSGEAAVDVYLPSKGHFDLMAASVTGDLWIDHPALPKGAFPKGLTTTLGAIADERVEILSAAGPISIYNIDPIPTFSAQASYDGARVYLP